MIDGDIFLLDELGQVPANELSPLYPLMDGRGAIEEIPMNPGRGRVEAAPGFAIVGAWNPNSSKHIAEALLSRFTLIADHTTDYSLARTMGVPERAVAFAEFLEAQREAGDVVWAPQFRELLAFKRDEDKRGTLYALQNLLSNAPALERDVIAAMAMERWGDVAGARKNVRAMRI
jgi:Mg-chelatase subunit ChlI